MRRVVPRQAKPQLARQTATAVTVPPPVGGKNSRDSKGIMPETDAIELVNWLPAQNGVRSRRGSASVTTGYPASAESLIAYQSGTDREFIAGAGATLQLDDANGTLTSLATGLSNARWAGDQLGANLLIANGADAPRNWNGSTLSTPTFSGDLATYGEENITGWKKHQNRMYAWDRNYPNFFYGGVNAVSGAFTEFNLENVSNTSGNIVEIKTITRDAGDGMDDEIAFILDTGEIVIYRGSNPADASAWALRGRFYAPPIIAQGCAIEWAGDILILTQADLVKVSDVINYGSELGGLNIRPSKLSGDITNDYNAYGSNFGWSLKIYPREGWIIINVPETTNSVYHQYVISTVTGSYTEFQGWDAQTFNILDGNLYFHSGTALYQGDVGLNDSGAGIFLKGGQAFSNLGTARRKKMSNTRLYLESEGELDIDFGIGIDYDFPNPQGAQTSVADGATWDVASWDTASWAGDAGRLVNFVVGGVGVFISPQVSLTVSGQRITWHSTTYNFNVAETY